MAIEFTKDVPEWIQDWVNWVALKLIPEWELDVNMKECIDKDVPECTGEVSVDPGYLRATASYQTGIENNPRTIVRVIIHEIVHIFMDNVNSSAEALISNKTVKATCWQKYEHAEEETVVRLSRVLYELRMDGKL